MAEIVNPYIAGAPVVEKRMFFGRDDVFDWIQRSLSGQYSEHILVVHGQRRVGKTSVLKQLGNQLPDRYIPVFFDLQGRTHTTLDRFMWWLTREIVRVLKQERDITIPPPDKELFTQDPDYFENRFLPDLKPFLGKDKVLLLTFDEFDNLEEGEVKDVLARPLIDHLRRLMEQPNLNFIFSIGSSGRKLENMQAAYTEFFKAALYKKISFLTKDDAYRLITLPVQGIIEYDQEAVQQIYDIVSGHPYFTQLVCHELFSQCQKTGQRTISRIDVDGILDDVVERGTVNLKFVWDEASDLEKWALSGIAQLEGNCNNRTLADFLIQQRVRFNQQAFDSALLHLREKDVLTDENRFVNHLLQIWMKKNRPIEQAREELTEVNPIANRYIEIGLEFKNNGLTDKAIESFKEALEIDSDNLQAQISLALVYLDQKNFEKSISEFEKAQLIDEEDIATRSGLCDAYLALGDQQRGRGRQRDAVQTYQKILVINAEHNEARQRMAEINRQRAEKALSDNNNEEALSAFSEALRYTPEDPDLIARVEQVRSEKKAKVLAAQFARSEKEANARNWEKAIAALNEALETSPNDETILSKIVVIKERQLKERLDAVLAKADQGEKTGRWDTAIAALNEYLNLNPSDALIQKRLTDLISAKHSAWVNGIITRADQAAAYQNWDEAITALNEVLIREPENAEIQKKVAKVRETRRIAELNALLKRVEAALQAGQWDEAINDLNNGVAAEPDNEILQAKLIEVRKAKREARLKAALRLVDSAVQSGKWGAAIEMLNEILAIEPDNAEFLQKLAAVKKGQRENSLKALQIRARGFVKVEKFDESLAAWNEYLALDPDDREKAQAEIESVKKAQGLASIYTEANEAFSKKKYEDAIRLFKSIVVENTDYKAATHLLAESIELRRTTRKWWKSRWIWVGSGALLIFMIGWFAFQAKQPMMITFAPTTSPIMTDMPVTTKENTNLETKTVSSPTSIPTSMPSPAPTSQPYEWARLNSGQFLPRDTITTIVFDPADSGVMYVGTDKAGLFKSIDGGVSWQPSNAGLERTWVYSHVIDPKDPQVQYIGTLLGGVYKSTDNGANWIPITKKLDVGWASISIVVIDPTNSQHIFYTQASQIYESNNGGSSWQEIHNGGSCPDNIVGLVVQPGNSSTLYLSQETYSSKKCDSGIYASNDGGHSWTFISASLPSPELNKSKGGFTRWDIALGGSKGETLFANNTGRLYRSNNKGATWERLQAPNCNTFTLDAQNGLNGYCVDMNSINQTLDGGNSWAEKSRIDIKQSDEQTMQTIAISPLSSDIVLVGGPGLWLSNDAGKTFEVRNSGLAAIRSEIGIEPSNPSALLLQVGDSCDFYRSPDGAHTWENVAKHSCYMGISLASMTMPMKQSPASMFEHPAIPEKLFAVYWRGQSPYIFISDNSGKTWRASAGMGSIADGKLFFDHDQGKRVYAVGDLDIFRSDDVGETWRRCSTMTDTWSALASSRMIIDPRNADHLTLATRGNGVLVSRDGCQSWTESNKGLGSLFVNTLTSDIKNPETIYAGTDGGGYVSTDGGQTWGQVNDGLLGANVIYSLLVDKDSNVLGTTPYGIFKLEKK